MHFNARDTWRVDKRGLGQLVRRLRERANLSQERLGSDAGVARNTIYQIEIGEGNPTIDTIAAISDVLKSPLLEVFGAVRPKRGLTRPVTIEQFNETAERILARYEARLKTDRELAALDHEVRFLREQNRRLTDSAELLAKLANQPLLLAVFRAILEKDAPLPKEHSGKLGRVVQALKSALSE